MPTSGVVDQIMAGYIRDGIAKADREGYDAVVIELNTPGGDLNATREIVGTLLNSPLPVIVWVGPAGARAASAGTFITMAAHVATMAPGTNIGAATPDHRGGAGHRRGPQSEDPRGHQRAAAQHLEPAQPQRRLGADHRRRRAGPTPPRKRSRQGGVDGSARTVEEAIAFADGRTVQVEGESVTLALADAQTEQLPMNPLQSLLHLLSDPNIAFILFTIGFYGLFFELQNPNWVTGILGAHRDHPRLHRLRQPAAECRRPAADRTRDRALRARVHGSQPRPA